MGRVSSPWHLQLLSDLCPSVEHLVEQFNLTWNSHCETVYKKAVKRLYGLRVLKKAGMSTGDLVSVYCSIVRSTIEYVSPA